MRKSFLKTIVATAVVGTTLMLSSVAAYASIHTWVYEDDAANISLSEGNITGTNINVFGISNYQPTEIATTTGNTSRTATFKEAILSGNTAAVAGKVGLAFDTETTRYLTFTPTESGLLELYVCRTDNNSGTYRVYSNATSTTGTFVEYSGYGRDTKNIEPIVVTVEAEHNYTFYSNGKTSGIFALRLKTGSDAVWFPSELAKTSSVSGISEDEVVYTSGVTTNTETTGAVNHNGQAASKRITIGKAVAGSGLNVAIADMGFISFPGLSNDGFKVSINCASSSGATTERTVFVGKYDSTNNTFTDIDNFNIGAQDTIDVEITKENASVDDVYAVYLKPKADTKASENLYIYGITGISLNAYETATPTITLTNGTLTDGKIVVVGTFNNFSGYTVNNITLNAASGKATKDAAAWTDFTISNVKKNSDGNYYFTAKLKNMGVKSEYQATADYVGNASSNAEESGTAASNVLTYIAE